jgi:hypothetical protein
MGPRSATGRLRSLLLAATVTLLWLPATASAVTFGADLNQPANNPVTCADGWPNQLYQGNPFEQSFYNTGNGSCMWTGSGVAQTLYAPSSGTVAAVRVKVGAVSGQMQIVVIRTLYRNTFEPGRPELACCVIEHYGPTFTPQANAVTTVATSLSVVEEPTPPPTDTTTIAAGDLLALEVLEPNVPVPAYTATGGATEAGVPDFAWFPAPSQAGVPTPSPNVVSYNGDFSGYQVLMNAEMGGGPNPSPNPNPNPNPLPPPLQQALPALTFPNLTLPVKNGRITLPLQCASANCVGNVLLQNAEQTGARLAAARGKHKSKTITYGSGAVNLPVGAKGKVTIKLNSAGKQATRHKRLKVWASFTFGSTKLSKRITLHG